VNTPSAEQNAIVEAELGPMAVLACAGSGKTRTAIHRLAAVSKSLEGVRGRVALLSFTNVAVDTFRRGYRELLNSIPPSARRAQVEIDTLDGFCATHVLRPHAFRTMGATRAAFLVLGNEAFLDGFTVRVGNWPRSIESIISGFRNGAYTFCCSGIDDQLEELDTAVVERIVKRLGKTGGYTFSLGRYWCLRTLEEQPLVLRALARRYPHILIDEAQDIGTVHQAILEKLIATGVSVSLIGDPNQSIYGFAGANGDFLKGYGRRMGVFSRQLTRNYRSVPIIAEIANKLASRSDSAHRESPQSAHGVFYIGHKEADREKLVAAFRSAVIAAKLMVENSAVLCRGRSQSDNLSGNRTFGQGTVQRLARAAILRDRKRNCGKSFKEVVPAIIGLIANAPDGLAAKLTQPGEEASLRKLRRLLWGYMRNEKTGLPSATLLADKEWHPALVKQTKALLEEMRKEFGLESVATIGNRLARTKLPNTPLVQVADLASPAESRIRIDTVHQAKGESLDAVLYIASKKHATAMLDGVGSELGRIGYVALTRARNLVWLGIPLKALEELRPKLEARGFKEAGVSL
jgi:superfamily I DNA/RNA helicase